MKKHTEQNLTAYCGLYCGDCIRYKSKLSDMARDIIIEFENTNFAEYAKVKKLSLTLMADYKTMIGVLNAVSQIKCETPCRLGGDGCGGSCTIIKCVKNRSLEGCWECHEFENCDRLDFLRPFHGDAPVKNLRKIRDLGIDSWAEHREKCYPWL
ncbi:MAG: DUF3795 domain-containing protein [Smithella sp.]|nr:DUF3795 domain-containing protein [Smithella sp.]